MPASHRLGRDVLDRGQAAREPLAVLGLAGRQREAAVAHHHGGDAVPARAAAERVPGDLRVHVGVAVDEAGRDDQPLGVDLALGRLADAADLDDPAVLDADIGADSAAARSVDDGAVFDQEVETHCFFSEWVAMRVRCPDLGFVGRAVSTGVRGRQSRAVSDVVAIGPVERRLVARLRLQLRLHRGLAA